MRYQTGRPLVAVGLLLAAGCANPADESTPAKISEPIAVSAPVATTEVAPSDDPAPAAAKAGGLPIDAAASKIEFVGSKVTGSHAGGFKDYSGTVTLAPDGQEVASVRAEIRMDSTYSDDPRLTGHLKSPDFFDVAKFPTATFESTGITPGGEKGATHTITGNFTLHGVTKSISFPATIKVDDKSAAIDSDFFINRKSFGIEYPGKSDDLIRDEVVIKLAVRAPKG